MNIDLIKRLKDLRNENNKLTTIDGLIQEKEKQGKPGQSSELEIWSLQISSFQRNSSS
jgi:hypothetical protein